MIQRLFWTAFMNVNLFLWNIRTGKNCRFYGQTGIVKKPGSMITIGNDCTFRSTWNSNYIGINHPCLLSTSKPDAVILIGNDCGFSGTIVGAFKSIVIGNNVRCGANTLITDSDWHLDDKRVGDPKPVIIEDNVWLGVNSVVLKGVTIGTNSVIGANSVVTGDIPANVIAGGNPCKVLKQLIS
jgi:acetyltransferase-like isoleucine patch superfamily enzyme